MSALSESEKQRMVDIIRGFVGEQGYPPTVTQLCEATGMSRGGIFRRLETLARSGLIEKGEGPRALKIVDRPAGLREKVRDAIVKVYRVAPPRLESIVDAVLEAVESYDRGRSE